MVWCCRFAAEWDVTSSHRVRSPDDMQYAFSYFYYLMGLQDTFSAATVFQQMDTDKSG
jgi:UDP-N-acetylglucosamine-lysosomal-enzyme